MTSLRNARPRIARLALTLACAALAMSACVAGENAAAEENSESASEETTESAAEESAADDGDATWSADHLTVDWATYNPLSLVIRDQQLLETALGDDVTVEWIQSAGSNKANEGLRSGSLDVGSTAGSAALLARANGSPIKTILVYSQPEWSALVVPAGSEITSVADLAGKQVAATKGTDPYFFLLQSLEANGLSASDITIQNLQHADGRTALEAGSVDAWAGLDPLMAASEATAGSTLLYRNVDFNTYGVLNATEAFLEASPDLAQVVADAYRTAQEWAEANPEALAELLAEVAGIDLEVASTVIVERSNVDVDQVPGQAQLDVMTAISPILVDSGDVTSQEALDDALANLIEPAYAEAATPLAQ